MSANPSTANASKQLLDRLLATLPAGYSESTVELPNIAFTKPTSSKWLRATIIIQDVNNVQAGGLWLRYDGLFVVDVLYPLGDGTINPLTDAEAIAAIYQNQKFGGVNCQEALILDIGEEKLKQGKKETCWYHVQVEVDFYYEG